MFFMKILLPKNKFSLPDCLSAWFAEFKYQPSGRKSLKSDILLCRIGSIRAIKETIPKPTSLRINLLDN